MRVYGLIFIFLLLSFGINAQSVTKFVEIKRDALDLVPQENRKRLVERLILYIKFINNQDAKGLYNLISVRVKKKLSEEAFIKSAKFESEGKQLLFSIREAKKANEDDYNGEPKPEIGEGYKWIVRGCMKFKDNKGKIKFYERSYDLWFTDNEWYISRNGFYLDNGGYKSCN